MWERAATKKVRRITYHVVRGAKKFVVGSGNAAWVMGTTMLVMGGGVEAQHEAECRPPTW